MRRQHGLNGGRPLLRRSEERTLLNRAIEEIAADPSHLAQLRQDTTALREAMARLAEEGTVLARSAPSVPFANPAVERTMHELQAAYHRRLATESRPPFEDAALAFMRSAAFKPSRYVYFEGFTFLTPLQRQFVNACHDHGSTLVFIYPYRQEQARGFEVMRRTYGGFGVAPRPVKSVVSLPEETDLGLLKRALFSVDPPPTPPGDGTVVVRRHAHRHQEVEACIADIQAELDAGTPRADIAVVMRDPRELQALLQETAEIAGLKDAFAIPPRLLLLTPLGRFVLTLYEVGRDGSFSLTDDQFEAILASGWLGAHLQATTERFAGLRPQFFARCRSFDDWNDRFRRALAVRPGLPPDSRLPLALATERDLKLWQAALEQVHLLCERLFDAPEQSIGDHVQRLRSELRPLARENLFQTEREIVERIEEVLDNEIDAQSLEMSASEFGDVLSGLVREYQQAAVEDEEPPPDKIWLASPEGMDGQTRPVVFYLGVDNRRVPRAFSDTWPLVDRIVEEYHLRERYYFLAVVRAATRRLVLSYALADADGVYRASPYLELDELRAIVDEVADPLPTAALMTPADDASDPVPAIRERYHVTEIAQFALCPYRYKLERLSRSSRHYRDAFQLSFAAQGRWLRRTFECLVRGGKTVRGVDQLTALFHEAMDRLEPEVRAEFPALRPGDWVAVSRETRRILTDQADYHGSFGFDVTVIEDPGAELVVPIGDRHVEVDASTSHAFRRGRYPYASTTDLLHEEWLLHKLRRQDGVPAIPKIVDGVSVFPTLESAVSWWEKAIRAAHFQSGTGRSPDYPVFQHLLRDKIQLIEAGHFPKHRGDHCRYCPVFAECMGLQP